MEVFRNGKDSVAQARTNGGRVHKGKTTRAVKGLQQLQGLQARASDRDMRHGLTFFQAASQTQRVSIAQAGASERRLAQVKPTQHKDSGIQGQLASAARALAGRFAAQAVEIGKRDGHRPGALGRPLRGAG